MRFFIWKSWQTKKHVNKRFVHSFTYTWKTLVEKNLFSFWKEALSTVLYINVCARVLEFYGKRSNLLPYFFISSYLPKNMDSIWIILVPIILFQLVCSRFPKNMLFCLRTYRYPVRRFVYWTMKPSNVDAIRAIVSFFEMNFVDHF